MRCISMIYTQNKFDVDIKGVPLQKSVNEGSKPLKRVLNLSSASNGTNIRSARGNIFGKQ